MNYLTLHKKILTAFILGLVLFLSGGLQVYADATSTTTTTATVVDTGEEPVADTAGNSGTEGASLTGDGTGDALSAHFSDACGINHLTECIPNVVYYLFYKPASFLLIIAGKIFDYILSLSINRNFIEQDFVNNIWVLMRDFANMAFIFVLLYAGISTMLRMGDWAHTVKMVVIVALFINFSLFFTKVVIDAGNIMAVGIYGALGTDASVNNADGSIGLFKREISGNLVAAFQPQNFISTVTDAGPLEGIIVFLVAGVVNVAVAWAFFTIALVFIGRIVAFWVLMMFSPIAFVSIATPKSEMFTEWMHTLVSQAFVAPVFLFFMYIILKVVENLDAIKSSGGLGEPPSGGFIADKLFIPVIMAIILVFAIGKARDYAKSMAGEFGNMGSEIGGKVMGVAGGFALGGAAMVGRKTIGRLAESQMERLKGMSRNPNSATARFVGRNLTLVADKTRGASFDVRHNSLVQQGAQMSGVNIGDGGGEGGYAKVKEETEKKLREKELARANVFAEIPPEEEQEMRRNAETTANAVLQNAQVEVAKNQGEVTAINEEITAAAAAQKQASQALTSAAKRLEDAEEAAAKVAATGTQADRDEADRAVQRAKQAKDTADATNSSAVASLNGKKTELEKVLEDQKKLQEAAAKALEDRDKAGDKAIKDEQMKRREQYARSWGSKARGTEWSASNEEVADFVQYIRNPDHEADALKKAQKKLRDDLKAANDAAMTAARNSAAASRRAGAAPVPPTPPPAATPPPVPPVTP